MTKAILIFALAAISSTIMASDKTKSAPRKPAQVDSKSVLAVVFQSYLACRPDSKKDLAAVKECVKQVLAPKTEQYRIDRLSTWLLMPTEVTIIRDCTDTEAKRGKYFPERTEHSLCFDFKIGNMPKTGKVYFRKAAEKSYLYSFDY